MAILLPEVFYTKNLNTAPTPTETKQDIALLYCIFSCQDFVGFASLDEYREHTFMTFTHKGGWGNLKICQVFADFILFQQ